jgi:hypothetical protein
MAYASSERGESKEENCYPNPARQHKLFLAARRFSLTATALYISVHELSLHCKALQIYPTELAKSNHPFHTVSGECLSFGFAVCSFANEQPAMVSHISSHQALLQRSRSQHCSMPLIASNLSTGHSRPTMHFCQQSAISLHGASVAPSTGSGKRTHSHTRTHITHSQARLRPRWAILMHQLQEQGSHSASATTFINPMNGFCLLECVELKSPCQQNLVRRRGT